MSELQVMREIVSSEEMAKHNALDLVRVLADDKKFPCGPINEIMVKLMILLEYYPGFDLQIDESFGNDGGGKLPRYEVRCGHENEQPVHILMVPVGIIDLEASDKKAVSKFLTAFVGAVSLVVENGGRRNWMDSRMGGCNEVLEKGEASLENIVDGLR
jgi:hypothetical protein